MGRGVVQSAPCCAPIFTSEALIRTPKKQSQFEISVLRLSPQELEAAKMSASVPSKCALAGNPLEHKGILLKVFGYLCFGCWLYLVPVCKRWHAEYKALAERLLTQRNADWHGSDPSWCGDSHNDCMSLTSLRAAFSSVGCLQMATANGLQFVRSNAEVTGSTDRKAERARRREEEEKLQLLHLQLGKHASREVLLSAEEHGAQWSGWLCAGAAESGDLAKLQWLRVEQQCPWLWTLTVGSSNFKLCRAVWQCGDAALAQARG
jgi:hypothetical protein